MALFKAPVAPDAIQIFRLIETDVLGCTISRPFALDDYEWPTAEHYYQAMKYPGRPRFHDIRTAPTVELARKHAHGWLKRKRKDWSAVRTTVMMRALYTQAQIYNDFKTALLATGEKPIQEVAQYDYFWGTGRDQRGENQYGLLLMKLRDKLRAEIT